ncbi:helix-turn-helix domain-containing protein [Metabacillus fastidiosus]|uniref:helix-turn-helix domain-containing protein n=1 Tax=Metabacillus fastidiosus TaxID=1458 RepID=UPI002E1E9A5D
MHYEELLHWKHDVLTTNEVSELLGITKQRIWAIKKEEELTPVKKNKRSDLYLRSDVEEYAKKGDRTSKQLPRLEITHNIDPLLLLNSRTLVIGGIASGKTTLLKKFDTRNIKTYDSLEEVNKDEIRNLNIKFIIVEQGEDVLDCLLNCLERISNIKKLNSIETLLDNIVIAMFDSYTLIKVNDALKTLLLKEQAERLNI